MYPQRKQSAVPRAWLHGRKGGRANGSKGRRRKGGRRTHHRDAARRLRQACQSQWRALSIRVQPDHSDLVCAGDKSDGEHAPYPCPSCVSGRTLRSSSVSSAESGAAATTQQRTLERSYVFVRRCWWWGIRVNTAESYLPLRMQRRTLQSRTAWGGTMLPTSVSKGRMV